MGTIVIIAVLVGGSFTFVVVISVEVIIGIHREERDGSLMDKRAPGVTSARTRAILGRYVRRERPRTSADDPHRRVRS